MTSGLALEGLQLGSNGLRCRQNLWIALRTSPTKPSILPPLMSLIASMWSCGPPPLRLAESWYGFTHSSVWGSGEQTVGTPSFIGIPSAPGNVPK